MSQSEAPVSGHQASVWFCEGEVMRASQQHLKPDDFVCSLQAVNVAQAARGNHYPKMITPENDKRVASKVETNPKPTLKVYKVLSPRNLINVRHLNVNFVDHRQIFTELKLYPLHKFCASLFYLNSRERYHG